MAKSVTALKDILRRSESLLKKLKDTLPTIAHAKSAALLRQIIKGKQATIKTYKSILKEAKKCPAVKKTTKKATAKKGRAKAKPAAKKKVKKTAAKKRK